MPDTQTRTDAEFEDDQTARDPTEIAYGELQTAFDHFNAELFDSALPPCLITLQRRRSSYGYFAPARFRHADGTGRIDEIALNPQKWRHLPVEENLATLGHEMAHLWQHYFGTPSRRGYHNKEWAEKMTSIGLIPSHDGKPGGRQTGQHMMDYIAKGGRFDRACTSFLTLGYNLSFHDLTDEPEGGQRQNKTKFTCPDCGCNAWGKPDLNIRCEDCRKKMEGTKQQ